MDGSLKALIANEFYFQKDFLTQMALELTNNEKWDMITKDLDTLYPNPSLHF